MEITQRHYYSDTPDMKRKIIVVSCTLLLIFGMIVVGINFNTLSTILGIALTSLVIYYFIISTDGLFTGYLEILNSDVEKAKANVALLMSSSTKSVKIISATLSPAIYCQPEVFNEIAAAKERGIKFQIVLSGKTIAPGPKIKPTCEEAAKNFNTFWEWVKDGEIEVKCYPGDPWPHLIVVDDLHVRVEEKHKIVLYPDSRICKRRAKTHLMNPKLAKKYADKFQYYRDNSSKYVFS